jgi:hypothetical protein
MGSGCGRIGFEQSAAPDASAREIVIGADRGEVHDAEVRAGTYADDNYLGVDHVSVDYDANALVWFDLSAIDSNAIVSATLSLYVVLPGDGTVTIHRVREAWSDVSATWNVRVAGTAWLTSGARTPSSDVDTLAELSPVTIGTRVEVALPVDMVAEWIADPASNFGILLERGTDTQHIHFGAEEGTEWSTLRIEFAP